MEEKWEQDADGRCQFLWGERRPSDDHLLTRIVEFTDKATHKRPPTTGGRFPLPHPRWMTNGPTGPVRDLSAVILWPIYFLFPFFSPLLLLLPPFDCRRHFGYSNVSVEWCENPRDVDGGLPSSWTIVHLLQSLKKCFLSIWSCFSSLFVDFPTRRRQRHLAAATNSIQICRWIW